MDCFFRRKWLLAALAVIALTLPGAARGQVKFAPDTLQCHMVGFDFGMTQAVAGSNSQGITGGSMRELYDLPSIDFGLDWAYKWASGWMVSLDADLWFGLNSNNLSRRTERYDGLFHDGIMTYSWGGYNGNLTAYNRGLAARPGVGYIVRILPKNPNSGVLLKASIGPFSQKTVFTQDFDQAPVPQLNGDYAKLYDQKRVGIMLTQGVGFLFMSNYSTYANFKIMLEVSECWNWSVRSYQIDKVMGLNGKDNSRYFDIVVGFKLNWMFPFTGKTAYDYYYF